MFMIFAIQKMINKDNKNDIRNYKLKKILHSRQ